MSVHVRRFGHGPLTVVALHGWAGSGDVFADLGEQLAETCTVLAPDLPGYGLSERPREWTLDAIAEALAGALESHLVTRGSPPLLFGACGGAVIAMHLARRMTTSRLVLAELFDHAPWYLRVFLVPILGRVAYALAFDNPIGRWLSDRSATDAGAHVAASDGFTRVKAETTLPWLRLLADAGPVDRYADLRLPVTLLNGAHTFSAVRLAVRSWRRIWPWLQVRVVADAGHLLVQEQPEAVAETLRELAAQPNPPLTTPTDTCLTPASSLLDPLTTTASPGAL